MEHDPTEKMHQETVESIMNKLSSPEIASIVTSQGSVIDDDGSLHINIPVLISKFSGAIVSLNPEGLQNDPHFSGGLLIYKTGDDYDFANEQVVKGRRPSEFSLIMEPDRGFSPEAINNINEALTRVNQKSIDNFKK